MLLNANWRAWQSNLRLFVSHLSFVSRLVSLRKVSRCFLVLRLLFGQEPRKRDDVCVDRLSFPLAIAVIRHDVCLLLKVLVCVVKEEEGECVNVEGRQTQRHMHRFTMKSVWVVSEHRDPIAPTFPSAMPSSRAAPKQSTSHTLPYLDRLPPFPRHKYAQPGSLGQVLDA